MRAGAGMCVASAVVAAWAMRSEIVAWVYPPPEPLAYPEKGKEPRIAAVIDSNALIQGCREAMRRYTPGIPGWKVARLECTAKFGRERPDRDPAGVEGPAGDDRQVEARGRGRRVSPSQGGREAPVAWKTARRGAGFEAQVDGSQAWMVVELPPVAVEAAGSVPSRLAVRGMVDRRFGLRASRIEHSEKAEPSGS